MSLVEIETFHLGCGCDRGDIEGAFSSSGFYGGEPPTWEETKISSKLGTNVSIHMGQMYLITSEANCDATNTATYFQLHSFDRGLRTRAVASLIAAGIFLELVNLHPSGGPQFRNRNGCK